MRTTRDDWEEFVDPRTHTIYHRSQLTGQWQWNHWDSDCQVNHWVDCDAPPDGLLVSMADYERGLRELRQRNKDRWLKWSRRPWEPKPQMEAE